MGGAVISHTDTAIVHGTGNIPTRSNTTERRTSKPVDPSGVDSADFDWERLERAVSALVAQQERLQEEARDLRRQVSERNDRVRQLEAQLLEANQRRQDTGKQLDELIAQLDQLDAQLAASESPK